MIFADLANSLSPFSLETHTRHYFTDNNHAEVQFIAFEIMPSAESPSPETGKCYANCNNNIVQPIKVP